MSNPPDKEPFCWYSMQQIYTGIPFKRSIGYDVAYSWFDGDGFGRGEANVSNVSISPQNLVATGPPASVYLRYGYNLGQHQTVITVNDSTYLTDEFNGFKVRSNTFSVPLSLLQQKLNLRIASQGPSNDRHTLAGVELIYPRSFDFGGVNTAVFELDASLGAKYLEISGINPGSLPVLYDLTNQLRLEPAIAGNLLQVLLPPSATKRRIIVSGSAGITAVNQMAPIQFHDFSQEQANFIIISNPALRKDAANGNVDQVQAYADYRASLPGGAFKSTIVDINELYEQFAYGIRFHPFSIRNFCYFLHKNQSLSRYLLLIGKGVDYKDFRSPAQQGSLENTLFFLPDYGAPGSDLEYVMRGNQISRPIFPIGRLAVTKPSEIRNYLQKVIEHEQGLAEAQQNIGDRAWLKKVLHISGGLSEEQVGIKTLVQSMTDEISNNGFGAEVETFYKSSNDPIQVSAFERVKKAVNGGLSTWMTFGHSSPYGLDFDIGTVDSYQNTGRYPLMFIMGCFSGICANPTKGLGENFVLAPEKGALAYLAPVNFGFTDALHAFGKRFYAHLGGAEYGSTLGLTIVNTIGSFEVTSYPSLIAILHQMQLQGDPAVRLHDNQGPDYLVDATSVNISPNPVSIDRSSFDLDFKLVNLGRNTGGQVGLKITQQLPDNSLRLLAKDSVDAPAAGRMLHYTLPAQDNKVGYSRLFIEVDPDNRITETPAMAELNNSVQDASGQKGVSIYFYTDDVQPVLPEYFGIVGSKPSLYASSLALRTTPVRYLFEIDTTPDFSSTLLKKGELMQKSGLLRWDPDIPLIDSTVYFWRVARDSLVGQTVAWHGSSFLYLAGQKGGWNQSHFGQFVQGKFTTMQWKNAASGLEFSDDAASYFMNVAYRNDQAIKCPGVMNNFAEGVVTTYWWNVNNVQYGMALFQYNANTGHAELVPPGADNNPTPSTQNNFRWYDTRDSLQRIKLMEFLQHGLTPNANVGLITVNYNTDMEGYAPWKWAADSITYGKNLFQVLESLGAKDVRKLANSPAPPYPYGIMFKAGHPESPAWDTIVTHPDSLVNHRINSAAKWYTGNLESPPIGPAKSWAHLYWKKGVDDDSQETNWLSVLGHRPGQVDTLLMRLQTDFDADLSGISAAKFPYLKVQYEAADTNRRTVTQPHFFRILYQGVPEGALNPTAFSEFHKDTLQQGDVLKSAIAYTNISGLPMDSVLVRYRVENSNGVGTNYPRKYKPLAPGDSIHTAFSLPTQLLTGKNRLAIDVNPDNNQPELYHFNNVAFLDFYVQHDNRNPLLDVTFDGNHILDGDLISPRPEVIMSLKDDNPFLALQDTSTFRVSVLWPDGSTHVLAFNDPTLLFIPAAGDHLDKKNQARLEWRPELRQDGDYRLQVNGRDASGNLSAAIDYSVTFQVITKSSLSNVLNYPNPFSTSTCFVYTMTGAETPASFKIQIMTVSGRVVREITTAEFGDLHAGTHRSDFCWDGKDEYGDQLANGVYLYRVVAKKIDGSDFELFNNEQADGFFKHGFGKMVLMR
ncbi:MAG: C25 family cysteine peptidase [Saprospiraceae bacterium]